MSSGGCSANLSPSSKTQQSGLTPLLRFRAGISARKSCPCGVPVAAGHDYHLDLAALGLGLLYEPARRETFVVGMWRDDEQPVAHGSGDEDFPAAASAHGPPQQVEPLEDQHGRERDDEDKDQDLRFPSGELPARPRPEDLPHVAF